MKICSLFSGIGGIETGFTRVFKEAEIVFSSEIDVKTAQAYELWFGHKPHGDITKISENDIPDHDILVGGFPCQAFSMAGKRLGFEDTRGTLFFDVARIVKHKKPKMFILENVKGLLSHDGGKTFSTIISILSDLGYLIDFEIMNSKYFDVPQNRERIVIIGLRNDKYHHLKADWVINSPHKKINEFKSNLQIVSNSLNFPFPFQFNVNKKLLDILEQDVDAKYTLPIKYTEDLIKQINQKIHKNQQSIDCEVIQMDRSNWNDLDRQRRLYNPTGIGPTLLARPDSPKIIMVGKLNMKAGEQIKSVYSEDGLSPTIDTAQGGHRQVKILVKEKLNNDFFIRKMTPLEALRVQGFSDNFYYKLREYKYSNSQIYKMAGNAVTVNVFEAIALQVKNII